MGSMLTNPLATRQIVYLTIPEVAEYLRVSPRTVYRWLREVSHRSPFEARTWSEWLAARNKALTTRNGRRRSAAAQGQLSLF